MQMKSSLAITLVALAVTAATAGVCPRAAARQPSKAGTLNGRVGATKTGGEVLPPESATIYILFSSEMVRDSVGREVSFAHATDLNTAGGQYSYQLNNMLEKNKELRRLEKSARHNARPEDANQIATYMLQSVDEALTRVRDWLTKHPDRNWQMKAVAPDAQGFWSAEGLPPGGYEVVVRGTLPGYDADWEGSVDLSPGGTLSLLLTRPRFFCRK
jgi:hypothetical protein